jgi:hypothetical protein
MPQPISFAKQSACRAGADSGARLEHAQNGMPIAG